MKVQFLSMLFILSISSSCSVVAQPKSSAVDSLEYIKKFSHVAPERSRQELIQSFHLGKELKLNKQVEWYTLGGTIGLKLNDLSLFKRSVSELGKIIDKPANNKEIKTVPINSEIPFLIQVTLSVGSPTIFLLLLSMVLSIYYFSIFI